MSGKWFGGEVNNVLRKLQNVSINVDKVGGTSVVEAVMSKIQGEIISKMPARDRSFIGLSEENGFVSGHIIVSSANDGQTAIDVNQIVPQTASDYHVFINYSGCGTPINNKGYEAVLGTDYTIEDDVPDFSVKPLSTGTKVITNYYTKWDDNYGLDVLTAMLEERAFLHLSENIGQSSNPAYINEIETRRQRSDADIDRMRKGDLVPAGIQQLALDDENEVNDDSNQATIVIFRRGGR